MSKGSKRRPRLVTREQYEQNWLSTFKEHAPLVYTRPEPTVRAADDDIIKTIVKGGDDHGR